MLARVAEPAQRIRERRGRGSGELGKRRGGCEPRRVGLDRARHERDGNLGRARQHAALERELLGHRFHDEVGSLQIVHVRGAREAGQDRLERIEESIGYHLVSDVPVRVVTTGTALVHDAKAAARLADALGDAELSRA